MSREIELKFLCAPADLPRLLAAAPAGEDETRELTSIYYDTPDGALARAGVSLRVRDGGAARVQTLKRGRGVSREEHEAPVAALDRGFGPLPGILSAAERAALSPTLEVRITRRQRLIRYGGAEIELACDLGEVRAAGRVRPISELELELKSGPRRALFALARELRRVAPLQLSFESKSAQGRALL